MKLNEDLLHKMTPKEWYEFLRDKYFEWKLEPRWRVSAKRRLDEEYEKKNRLDELYEIKNKLLECDKNDIEQCLGILSKIKGMKSSVASGLLALLYPKIYGTVDRFAIESLQKTTEYPDLEFVNPKNIHIKLAVHLIHIFQTKANELNRLFKTDFWTPRKIDMVLWSYREKTEKSNKNV